MPARPKELTPKSILKSIDPDTGLMRPPFTGRNGRKNQGSAKAKRWLRRFVLERDDFTCQECGERFEPEDLTLGHKIPHSLGGPLVAANLRAECEPCNKARGAVPVAESAQD